MSENCQNESFTQTSESSLQRLFVALIAQVVDLLAYVVTVIFLSKVL